MERLRQLLQSVRGQDLGEYALLFAFIALAVIAAVQMFGGAVNTFFGNAAAAFTGIGV